MSFDGGLPSREARRFASRRLPKPIPKIDPEVPGFLCVNQRTRSGVPAGMRNLFAFLFFAFLLPAGCAHAPATGNVPATPSAGRRDFSVFQVATCDGTECQDTTAIREELMKADRDFNSATQARGREGARSFLAEEFRMIGNKSIESGRHALLNQWQGMWDGKSKLTWEPVAASYLPQAGIGVTTGKWTRVADDAGPKSGRYTTWWRKQADGMWKAIGDGGSADCLPCGASK